MLIKQGLRAPRRPARVLPVVSVPVGQLRITPRELVEGRAVIDGKLDAMLQALIVKQVVPALRRGRGLSALADRLAKRGAGRRAPTIAKLLDIDTPLAN